MTLESFNKGLFEFLDASPTPYHAVAEMWQQLSAAGFELLDESETWHLKEGHKYCVIRNGGSIIAFTLPKKRRDFVMFGAHTDSPNLKIKPNPVIKKEGVIQLGIEPYGGVLINPWFDRDLSLAGKVAFIDKHNSITETLIDFGDPIASIPSLAIHLDAQANKEHSVNMQNHIAPVIATDSADFDFETFLKTHILDAKEILSYDVSLYDVQKAVYVGLEREFIASARLDNLLSCYVALQSILHVTPKEPVLMVCSDHEEVGSASSSGASGPFLEQVLRRIECDNNAFVQMVRSSLLISCDNAHAVHPNYSDRHEPNHKPQMNKGVVLKSNVNQRYASNTVTLSRFKHAAQQLNEPVQYFVTRSDLGCGSTIGPLTATRLGIETVDVGLPMLAMHSIRELAGSKDALGLYRILLKLSHG